MAPRSAWMRTAATYAVRYGPVIVPLVRQAQAPAQEAARRAWEVRRAERTADDHAATVRAGSVLPVVDAGRRCWVVFSGDEPIAAYPPTEAPLPSLLVHADLDRRRPPRPRGRAARAARAPRAPRDTGPVAPDAAAEAPQRPTLRSAFSEGWRAQRRSGDGDGGA